MDTEVGNGALVSVVSSSSGGGDDDNNGYTGVGPALLDGNNPGAPQYHNRED